MKIKRLVGGSLESNGYIISRARGGSCYVIDPGYEPKRFITYIEEEELRVLGVILTHHHHDHVGGADPSSVEVLGSFRRLHFFLALMSHTTCPAILDFSTKILCPFWAFFY